MQVTLHLADYIFMLFVIITLVCLATRRDALLPTSIGLLLVGTILKGSVVGGLQVAFNAITAATTDLLNIILVIAFVVVMTKIMEDMGSDKLMVAPIRRFLGNPNIAFWVVGGVMLVISWFIWPTPAAALVGALVLPVAIRSGLPPMIAAMALAIFGKGIALSSDFVIQGTPAVTSKLTHIDISTIIRSSIPIWIAVSVVATVIAFFVANRAIREHTAKGATATPDTKKGAAGGKETVTVLSEATGKTEVTKMDGKKTNQVIEEVKINASAIGKVMAWVIPLAFLVDIYIMFTQKIRGGDATALIGGTVLAISVISASFQYGDKAFGKIMEHARSGWQFAVKVFGPVVMISGFFWLGGDSLKVILGDPNAQGLMFDWGYFIANHVPITKAVVAVMVTIAGILAAFDGSGYAAIPLGASIAMALGTPIHANVSYLAAMAQMAAIWTGATLVPWGFLAVSAAMAGVDPQDLARRNMLPTLLGLLAGVIVTVILA